MSYTQQTIFSKKEKAHEIALWGCNEKNQKKVKRLANELNEQFSGVLRAMKKNFKKLPCKQIK